MQSLGLASSAGHHDKLNIDLPLVSKDRADGYEPCGLEDGIEGEAYMIRHAPVDSCCSQHVHLNTQHIVHDDPSPLQTCRDSEAMPSAREGKARFSLYPEIPAACLQLGHQLL